MNENPTIKHDGWLTWEVVTAAGVVVQHGRQHNMITNDGLRLMGEMSLDQVFLSAGVGTGSAEPQPTDTALVSSLAKKPGDGGTMPLLWIADGVYRGSRTIEFAEAEGVGNLTEWGLYSVNTLTVRELFRDGSGTPVVVSKDNTQKLRLTYTVQLTISPVVPTPVAFDVAGLGRRTGQFCWVDRNRGVPGFVSTQILNRLLWGAADLAWSPSAAPLVPNLDLTGTFLPGAATSRLNGFRRAYVATLNTDQANGSIKYLGQQYQNYDAYFSGFVLRLDDGQEIVKDNQHKLVLEEFVAVAWGH